MRRVTDRIIIALAVAAFVVGGPPATAGAEEGDTDEAEKNKTAEKSEPTDEQASGGDSEKTDESDEKSGPSPAPGPYRVAVGLSGGRMSWDTPHGTREGEWVYGITGRYVFLKPLFASLTVDHSRYSPTAGDLTVANRHVAMMAGAGAEYWLDHFRFAGELQGGALLRTLTLGDASGEPYTQTRFRPAWGAKIGVGTGIMGTAALNLTMGLRGYAPGRLDIAYGLQLEWIFSNGKRQ